MRVCGDGHVINEDEWEATPLRLPCGCPIFSAEAREAEGLPSLADAGFDLLADAALNIGVGAEEITVGLIDEENRYVLRVENELAWGECPVTREFLEDSAVNPAEMVAREVVDRLQEHEA